MFFYLGLFGGVFVYLCLIYINAHVCLVFMRLAGYTRIGIKSLEFVKSKWSLLLALYFILVLYVYVPIIRLYSFSTWPPQLDSRRFALPLLNAFMPSAFHVYGPCPCYVLCTYCICCLVTVPFVRLAKNTANCFVCPSWFLITLARRD